MADNICNHHDWNWNYDCLDDALIHSNNSIGIPVKCSKCGAEGIKWYNFSTCEITKTAEDIKKELET